MKLSVFFISLCLILLGYNSLHAITFPHANTYSLTKQAEKNLDKHTLVNAANNQRILQNLSLVEPDFLMCDLDDEEEKKNVTNRYNERQLAKCNTNHYHSFTLHLFYKTLKVSAPISAYTSHKYILQRTLRI